MTEIFKFENQQVRFVGTAEDPWWVAADICQILELGNVSKALARLDEDEKGAITLSDTIGREQNYSIINESGLYSLILGSRKPIAKTFKKWVTKEVLPAIRKTGSYSISKESKLSIEEAIALSNVGFQSVQNIGVDKEVAEQIRLDSLMQMFPESQKLLKPYKEVIAASNPLPDAPMTATQIGELVAGRLNFEKVSAKKINSLLLQLGYQVSITRINSKGKEVHHYYKPTDKAKSHCTLMLSSYSDGEGKNTQPQLKWFPSIVNILVNSWG